MAKKVRTRPNRTSRYLWPIVNMFGKTFIKEINNLTNYSQGYQITHSVVEVGIGDVLFYRARGYDIKELLFVVIDTNGCYNEDKNVYVSVENGRLAFSNFLKYIRTTKYYHDDYWYKPNKHCIVFNLEDISSSYWNFFAGKYSKMWNDEQMATMQITPKKNIGGKIADNVIHAVFTKNKEVGRPYLQAKVYEAYGTSTLPDEPNEYDIPWFIEDEFLNFQYRTDEESEKIKAKKSNNVSVL